MRIVNAEGSFERTGYSITMQPQNVEQGTAECRRRESLIWRNDRSISPFESTTYRSHCLKHEQRRSPGDRGRQLGSRTKITYQLDLQERKKPSPLETSAWPSVGIDGPSPTAVGSFFPRRRQVQLQHLQRGWPGEQVPHGVSLAILLISSWDRALRRIWKFLIRPRNSLPC